MISTDLLKGAFGENPHDVYMAYDKLTDELIVRVIDPKRLAYVYEPANIESFALLVESESDEVIGFQLFNFVKDHLQSPNWKKTRSVWDNAKEFFDKEGYSKFRYDLRDKTPGRVIASQGLTMVQEALCV